MFATDNPHIGATARQSPSAHAKVCRFVLATIRVRFLPDVYETFAKDDYTNRKVWFGHKLDGLAYISANEQALYDDAMAASDDSERIAVYMRIPGIGIAKAGFICQLVFGSVGCLDSHNLKRFGIPENRFRAKQSPKARAAQIDDYVECCKAIGGSEYLWNSWCELIADKYHVAPEYVSQCHSVAC